LFNPYKTENYSIAESIDDDDSIVIVIHINMLEPDPSDINNLAIAESYKNEALNKIREWGFNPDDYNIITQYDGNLF
jgi:hypothetical protein